jgi:hypothetical protein
MNTVSTLTAVLLLSSLTPAQAQPSSRLGLETVPAQEPEQIQALTQTMLERLVKSLEKSKTSYVPRDAHAKAHGCVKAELTVPGNLKPELQQGIFSRAGTYRAWIRFSNGSEKPEGNDTKEAARGMAIKVTGVPGEKLLSGPDEEKRTQDFILISHPVFFAKNVEDMLSLLRKPGWFFATHLFHEARIGLQMQKNNITNPLQGRYFSMTPYRLGGEKRPQAVKYSARPVSCDGETLFPTPASKSPDFMREAMVESLHRGDACFVFQVQLQTDADRMPIEDPTRLWEESESPFQTVAKIRIRKAGNDGKIGPQDAVRTAFCENLSMNPWHSLPEHRPLGGLNRGRKVVYQAISKFRHERNGVPKGTTEPTGDEAI